MKALVVGGRPGITAYESVKDRMFAVGVTIVKEIPITKVNKSWSIPQGVDTVIVLTTWVPRMDKALRRVKTEVSRAKREIPLIMSEHFWSRLGPRLERTGLLPEKVAYNWSVFGTCKICKAGPGEACTFSKGGDLSRSKRGQAHQGRKKLARSVREVPRPPRGQVKAMEQPIIKPPTEMETEMEMETAMEMETEAEAETLVEKKATQSGTPPTFDEVLLDLVIEMRARNIQSLTVTSDGKASLIRQVTEEVDLGFAK